MDIKIKNIKISDFASEETLCFHADIYVGKEKIGWAKNQGYGGCTDYGAYQGKQEILKKAEAATQGSDTNLEFFIDEQVYNFYNAREAEKLEKKMKRTYEKYVCYGKKVVGGYSYTQQGFKSKEKLAEIVKRPNGKIALQNMVDRIKGKLEEGETILNTNLTELGITV